MKTYKLLKYIEPAEQSIKLWKTFTLKSEYLLSDNEEQIPVSRLIRQWYIEEVKDTRHPWRYWKPESHNTTHYCVYNGYVSDSNNTAVSDYKYWNAFETKELAQKELDKRKAIVKIMEYISDTYWIFEPDWSDHHQAKYSLYYNHTDESFDNERCMEFETYSPIWHFSCEKHLIDIWNKFYKELRIIYDIK